MLLSLLGALLPHILGLFGKKTDDTAKVEVEGLKTVDRALKYESLRILLIVVVSVITTLWTVEQIHDIITQWHHRAPDVFHLFGGLGVSSLFRRLL